MRIKRYIDIQPVVMEGWPDAHHVFLQVANQRFCVSPHGCETKEEAEWLRDQLCVALKQIVDNDPRLKLIASDPDVPEWIRKFADGTAYALLAPHDEY